MSKIKTITVGELRHSFTQLLELPDDTEVFFGGGDLSFYRTKHRGPADPNATALVQIEFNELYKITLDSTADD